MRFQSLPSPFQQVLQFSLGRIASEERLEWRGFIPSHFLKPHRDEIRCSDNCQIKSGQDRQNVARREIPQSSHFTGIGMAYAEKVIARIGWQSLRQAEPCCYVLDLQTVRPYGDPVPLLSIFQRCWIHLSVPPQFVTVDAASTLTSLPGSRSGSAANCGGRLLSRGRSSNCDRHRRPRSLWSEIR